MKARWGAAVFLAVLAGFLPALESRAQGFGQNHVIRRDFQWQVRSTEHFDIHYYEGSAALVPAAAEIVERSYRKISAGLNVTFDKRRPLFLYADANDFQQSNIVHVGDGTGGVTEPFKDRFMVYNDGTLQWLDSVLTHEMVHVFQFRALLAGFWKSVRILKTVVYPLWMMEGLSEYFTGGLDDTTGEIYMRDAATSGHLIPLWKLEHFSHLKPHQMTLAYKSGGTVMEFLESQYGPGITAKMLKEFESHFESNSVLHKIVGLDIMAFDKKWREYLEGKYGRVRRLEHLREPTAFGVQLTTSSGALPEFNISPVFTPDSRQLAYVSTRDGFPPEVVVKDMKSGRIKRLVAQEYLRIENIPTGNFTNISRVLAISPDGKTLAFAAQKNHVQSIYLYDLAKGRLRRIPLPGLTTVLQPAFSPEGQRLAFSGMKDGLTDIYLLDLETKELTQLTADPQDDQSPSFAPDGGSIVYSSEILAPGSDMPYQRRLFKYSFRDSSSERLADVPGAARDPVHSADGRRLLFTLEGWGYSDLYELDMRTRRVLRLTRTIGGSFTPLYAPNSDIVFSSFRQGSIHIHQGPREKFLTEEVAAYARAPSKPRSDASIERGITAWYGPGRSKASSDEPFLPSPSPDMAPYRAADELPRSGTPAAEAVASSSTPALSPVRPFKNTAGTDLFLPAFFYSSQGGLFWTSYWQGSDMLGNHQAGALVSYNSGQDYLNYQTQYVYGRYRPQFALVSYGHRANGTNLSNGLELTDSRHTQLGQVIYPLDRYHRLELLTGAATSRSYYPEDGNLSLNQNGRFLGTNFVRDTVGGRYLVAVRGSRLLLSYGRAARVLGGNVDYYTFYGEGHKFFPTGNMSALAVRVAAAQSRGQDAQGFVLGGIGGVRGYARSTDVDAGPRMGLVNAEYRFPILRNLDYYMWYIFPDFYFKAITAAVFTDAGYAWYSRPELSRAHWNSIRNSYGVGLRIHTFILQEYPLVLHFDYARRTTSKGGVFYVYLGPLF